jgi:nuclear pore complex protein Nup205
VLLNISHNRKNIYFFIYIFQSELLQTLELSKEIELLQQNRALGGPRHHRQVEDLFLGIRQTLADVVYYWAAQCGLPKDPTFKYISLRLNTCFKI